MAAGEHQSQPVVADTALVVVVFVGRFADCCHRCFLELGVADRVPAQTVICPIASGRLEPAARARRDPVARPALKGPGERILRTLLSQVPVAGDANQVRDYPPPLRTERLRDRSLRSRYISHTGLTSIVP